MVKIGSQYSARGLEEGVHWHINPNVRVEYIATDDLRENIPWVKYTNLETGEEVVYEDEFDPIDPDMMDQFEVRTMDCMDCHNRPSHDYKSPSNFIDKRLASGEIPSELPEIMSMSDRIIVMHNGVITGEVSQKEATKEKLLGYSMGVMSS